MSLTPNFPFSLEYKVRLYDTDAGGFVFFGNYFRIFSMAKDEYLETRFGSNFVAYLKQRGLALPTTEAFAKFHKGAKYGETLKLTTSVEILNPKAVRFQYRALNAKDESVLFAEGQSVSVMISTETGRSTEIPSDVLQSITNQVASKKET
ncbi:MAG: acyl-CoA thioesterase [Thaumarchaeota archaeon]|nr:acyl-CoA thioesterase [Nitrososphaerota archaeon]